MLELDATHRSAKPWLEKGYQFYQLGEYHFQLDWPQILNSTQPALIVIQTQ
jgi:hypothetical protein